jgi:hypothetical protein
MSRKDYLKAVSLIKKLDNSGDFSKLTDKQQVINAFAEFFSYDNSRFDRVRFVKACNEDEQ